jgi:hypothetical protein
MPQIAMHQEAHSNRGEASFATLKDLGIAVLKLATPNADAAEFGGGAQTNTLVAYAERTAHSSVSVDTTLESDGFTNKSATACFPEPTPRLCVLFPTHTPPHTPHPQPSCHITTHLYL